MKNFYESPQVEIIEVDVEKGFASSNVPGEFNPEDFGPGNDNWL